MWMTCKTVLHDKGRVVGVEPMLNYRLGFAVYKTLTRLLKPSEKSGLTYLRVLRHVDAAGFEYIPTLMLLLIIATNTHPSLCTKQPQRIS